MDPFDAYEIPIQGLEAGVHFYDFNLTAAFFELFEASPIGAADLDVKVILDKRETMLTWAFEIQGHIIAPCDRCLEEIRLPIHQSHGLVAKYGAEREEDSDEDEVVYIDPAEPGFQLAPFLYEFSCLSMPMVRTYDCENDENAPCNEEVLERLRNDEKNDEPGNTDLGEQLKDLGFNTN